MAAFEHFVEGNGDYAKDFKPILGGKKLVIVTCLDCRLEPTRLLGITEGDAQVIRNAGGRAQDALRSILILQHVLGADGLEIAVVHHTDCGATRFTDVGIRTTLQSTEACRASPELSQAVGAINFGAFNGSQEGMDASVREDVAFLAEHPLLHLRAATETEIGSKGGGKRGVVSGWIYDVDTGRVRRIV